VGGKVVKYLIVFCALFPMLYLNSCSEFPAAEKSDLVIVYTGNLNGELEPCGCAEETDLGGILRRAAMVDRLRQDNADMVLISAGSLINSNTWQDKIKAEYIFSALNLMDYDTIAVQWRDLAYSADYAQSFGLPWVSSNWAMEGFDSFQIIQRNQKLIAHFSWLDPEKSPDKEMQGATQYTHSDFENTNQILLQLKRQGAINILSTTLLLDEIQQNIDLDLLDIILIPSSDENYSDPYMLGNTLVLNYGTRGMRMAKLNLELDVDQNIISYRHEVFKLTKSVKDSVKLESWYRDYNDEVKEAYYKQADIRKVVESGQSDFVGAQACSACHENAQSVWEGTGHSGAYSILERVNKEYDPECIGCHTVGFNKSGGFIDLSVSSHLIDVQCESCHGTGRDHLESNGILSTENSNWSLEKICAQCHIGDHSPNFRTSLYWPMIEHGF
jgi:hypothetical protein